MPIETKIKEGIDQKIFSAAQFIVGRGEEILFEAHLGKTSFLPDAVPVTPDTLFDVSSLTKPVATTSLVLVLLGSKKIKLDQPIYKLLPDFVLEDELGDSPMEKVTIRHLLKHMSGLPAWRPYFEDLRRERPDWVAKREACGWFLSKIAREALEYPAGYRRLYSDLGFMLLGGVIEKITDRPLDALFGEQIAAPLSLTQTRFLPNGSDHSTYSIAATENCSWRQKVLIGEVHDDNAYAMGGVAGHAGLFSTARDLHRFVGEIRQGLQGNSALLGADDLSDMIGPKSKVKAGWDRPEFENSQAGSHFSNYSIGHLGFTGCSIWIDVEKGFHMILLTNRVHPSRENEAIKVFRPALHDLAYDTLLTGM